MLDTNIVTFIVLGEHDNLSQDTSAILEDHDNQLYVSSVSVTEFLQLYRIGKVKPKQYKTSQQLHDAIEKDFYIKILPFGKEHTKTLSIINISDRHNDPFDHAIISHGITEKLTLISSDRKFEDYTAQNLNFLFNKR